MADNNTKTQQQLSMLTTGGGSGMGPAVTQSGGGPMAAAMMSNNPSGGGGTPLGHTQKPVPMKLFSSWEVDRTPPNCIPRLCVLTLTHLTVQRPLVPSPDTTHSVFIAVKMGGSRRTLRSNEISLGPTGLTDTDLELHFSLQYPHFLKREENKLLIMLQRRKKYKNRTILGYRTLAEGAIDMALVLQRTSNLNLPLTPTEGGNKENVSVPVASVNIIGLSSQPVDDLDDRKGKGSKQQRGSGAAGMGQPGDFSDDDDDFSSQSSDSPPDEAANGNGARKGVKSTGFGNRNLKQKIVSLLRKFKQTEDLVALEDGTSGKKLLHTHRPQHHSESLAIEELFDELECLSDSEPDADTLSVGSMPRPVLPPFFASSRSLTKEHSQQLAPPPDSDSYTEPEPESPKFPRSTAYTTSPFQSAGSAETNIPTTLASTPSSSVQQQSALLDEGFPSLVVFVSALIDQGSRIASILKNRGLKQAMLIESETELKTNLATIVNKVQKFCNTNSKTPPPVTVIAVGNEQLLSWIAKSYVNQLSSKPHDWQSYFSFIFAPTQGLAAGPVYKFLCSQDTAYAQLFNNLSADRDDLDEFVHRLISYINLCISSQSNGNTSSLIQRPIVYLPIAEAMITYKEENEESSQVFVPFITDVRLNIGYSLNSVDQCQSCESNEPPSSTLLSSSPPSPQVIAGGLGPSFPREDPLELQIDYWKGTVKSSIKAHFRSLNIQRTMDNMLSLSYVLKEQKKQKIMRLGKKKDREPEANKNQCLLEGISRLVCLAKSQTPIKLHVDGSEWLGVKFFQISPQWPSGVKALPLLISRGSGVEMRGLDF